MHYLIYIFINKIIDKIFKILNKNFENKKINQTESVLYSNWIVHLTVIWILLFAKNNRISETNYMLIYFYKKLQPVN